MADMYDRALKGPTGVMYTSGFQEGACKDHGFSQALGQTCFGNTFGSGGDLGPHKKDEFDSIVEFMTKNGKTAVKDPGCAACKGHC